MIDGSTALSLLTQAVGLKGAEHVYESRYYDPTGMANQSVCEYWHASLGEEGWPGCIIGWALYIHGWPTGKLKQAGQRRIGPIVGTEFVPDMTRLAARIFVVAQRSQDEGMAWGLVLREAEQEALKAEEDTQPVMWGEIF